MTQNEIEILSDAVKQLDSTFQKLMDKVQLDLTSAPEIGEISKYLSIAKSQLPRARSEIQSYSEAVKHMALTKSNHEFGYKGMDHGLDVFNRFFQCVGSDINMFYPCLNSPIFDNSEFLFFLELCIKEGKNINLITKVISKDVSKSLDMLISYAATNPNVTVKLPTIEFFQSAEKLFTDDKIIPFIVCGTALILETDKDSIHGLCNFNDKKLTTPLHKLFKVK